MKFKRDYYTEIKRGPQQQIAGTFRPHKTNVHNSKTHRNPCATKTRNFKPKFLTWSMDIITHQWRESWNWLGKSAASWPGGRSAYRLGLEILLTSCWQRKTFRRKCCFREERRPRCLPPSCCSFRRSFSQGCCQWTTDYIRCYHHRIPFINYAAITTCILDDGRPWWWNCLLYNNLAAALMR